MMHMDPSGGPGWGQSMRKLGSKVQKQAADCASLGLFIKVKHRDFLAALTLNPKP